MNENITQTVPATQVPQNQEEQSKKEFLQTAEDVGEQEVLAQEQKQS